MKIKQINAASIKCDRGRLQSENINQLMKDVASTVIP